MAGRRREGRGRGGGIIDPSLPGLGVLEGLGATEGTEKRLEECDQGIAILSSMTRRRIQGLVGLGGGFVSQCGSVGCNTEDGINKR